MISVEPIRDREQIKEIEKRLAALNTDIGRKQYLLFMIGVYLARRISDMIVLRVDDLRGKEMLILREKKTKKRIELAIPQKLQRVLKQRLKGLDGNAYIFESRQRDEKGHKTHISRMTGYNYVKDIGRIGELEFPFACHSLRKTFGYHFYKKTHDIGMLMDLFNHSKERITLMYIGIATDEKRQALSNFEF
jgi:Phage integrase family.